VNVSELEALDTGTAVTPEILAENGWIRDAGKPVVILGNGDLSKKLTVSAHRFSKSAVEKITKAGGSTEVIEQKIKGARVTVKLLTREKLAKLNAE
jgi:large subunit ribosomal protein L15